MAARIVVAGDSQCLGFTQVCLVGDHLAKHLPDFCFEIIFKTTGEWKRWLMKMNLKNNWHHLTSPLIWKELLMKGSKPHYIGGASEFLEYCHSYYNLDVFMSEKIFHDLKNGVQYKNKLKAMKQRFQSEELGELGSSINSYVICITGAAHESTPLLISRILDLSEASTDKKVSKIYIYDDSRFSEKLKNLENDCSYIKSHFPGKTVITIEKLGMGLADCDLMIVMNHVTFREMMSIEDWLHMNVRQMLLLTDYINISASPKMRIIFPNFGPSCFNATVLSITTNSIEKFNIVVSTSDLGLEIMIPASEIADVPVNTMFCPPVWGFVGVNHLVDIRTTYHKYNSFYPYERCVKIRNSTLKIGEITPEFRTLEYLMHWDKSLWTKVLEKKNGNNELGSASHKIESLVGTINLWLFDSSPNTVTNLGVVCDGSFGLTLNGIFSQPSHFLNGQWIPAADLFPHPRDPYVKLDYLEKCAQNIIDKIKSIIVSINIKSGKTYCSCGDITVEDTLCYCEEKTVDETLCYCEDDPAEATICTCGDTPVERTLCYCADKYVEKTICSCGDTPVDTLCYCEEKHVDTTICSCGDTPVQDTLCYCEETPVDETFCACEDTPDE